MKFGHIQKEFPTRTCCSYNARSSNSVAQTYSIKHVMQRSCVCHLIISKEIWQWCCNEFWSLDFQSTNCCSSSRSCVVIKLFLPFLTPCNSCPFPFVVLSPSLRNVLCLPFTVFYHMKSSANVSKEPAHIYRKLQFNLLSCSKPMSLFSDFITDSKNLASEVNISSTTDMITGLCMQLKTISCKFVFMQAVTAKQLNHKISSIWFNGGQTRLFALAKCSYSCSRPNRRYLCCARPWWTLKESVTKRISGE